MNILLIDDNAEDTAHIREIIEKYLKKQQPGFSLVTIKSINHGIEILKNKKIGIILLSLLLPDTEGLEGLEKILNLFPGIPVIVFTALGNEESGTNAVYLGAMDYLVKGEINYIGLILSIKNSLVRHSLKRKTGYLSDYCKDNLHNLKKIIHYSVQTRVLPDFNTIFRELKTKSDNLAIPGIFSLFLVNKKKNQLILVAHNRPDWKDTGKPLIITDTQSILFEAVRRRKIIREDEFSQTGNEKNTQDIQKNNRGLCIPLVIHLEVIGVVYLKNHIGTDYSPEFPGKLKILLYYLAITVKDNLINKRLEELYLSDDLTGLYNRRYLIWELDREIKRVKRYRGSLSLLVMDIVDFRSINDTYGYTNGDTILKKIAIQLKKIIRITDLIGRYDGDEFIAVLTETGNKGALTLKKRILKNIDQWGIEIEGKTVQIQLRINSAEYDLKLKDAIEYIDYVRNLKEKQKEEKAVSVQEKKAGKSVTALHYVRIYFIEPLELISVVIDTLVKMGFESYQVEEKDKVKLLKILDKNARNVIFICITSQVELNTWLKYINKIEQMRDYMIQVGAFVYSRIDQQSSIPFLEKNIALIKFSDLQQDTLAVLKKILFYFEARGRRNYVRVDAIEDSMAFFTIEGERKVINARILSISEQIFTCYFSKKDIHLIIPGRYFLKVLLRLKGVVVQISARALSANKLDRFLWVMQIYSALYKNNKISFTTALNKEIKDKLHHYIRLCLTENIKEKLNQVQ